MKFYSRFLRQHPKLDYLQKCIRRLNDDEYVQDILALGSSPFIMKFHDFGDHNEGKNIIVIQAGGYAGFCSTLQYVLGILLLSERFGFVPVVVYHNHIPSWQKNTKDTSNVFEWYFEQVAGISFADAMHSKNVILYKGWRSYIPAELKSAEPALLTEDYLLTLAAVFKKYIRFNQPTYAKLQEDKLQIRGKNVLGVHIRGTDYTHGYDEHAVAIDPKEHIAAIEEVLDEYGFEKIFLATDEMAIAAKLKMIFKEKLVYYTDTLRSENQDPIHLTPNERQNHGYLLGYEVLRDVMSLSWCKGLIAGGGSAVANMARVAKAASGEGWSYQNIIYNGSYSSGKTINKKAAQYFKRAGKE